MSKKPFNHWLLILLLAVLLSTGCAHKPLDSLHETPNDAALDQSRTTTVEQTEEIAQNPDVEDDFEDEFFEDEFETKKLEVADPLYIWNKGMYHFNDKLYFWVLKPLTKGYTAITPDIFRTGVSNFFYNLMMPMRFVNCILQGKGNAAASEFTRFVVNTTIGVLGLGDPASQYPLLNISDDEDLGQTFAKYGIGNGFFLVWPIWGPSTLRDFIGSLGDAYLNPIAYIDPFEAQLAVRGFNLINRTSFHIGEYEALKEASVDPYVAMRNSYLQYREKKIKQ
ncbi:MAG: VacJ family lipoprotein [Desulfobacteraceae bacterium]|nr:VacJ family lipoprotein [Desulfobacteraceae bacterium]MDH3875834.1 VacJ family lipoprotein [Desulfobacteraceae bacterium]MDH3882073.1 VacJ family lipoprotein [Desulfobacteraceae bacterium]